MSLAIKGESLRVGRFAQSCVGIRGTDTIGPLTQLFVGKGGGGIDFPPFSILMNMSKHMKPYCERCICTYPFHRYIYTQKVDRMCSYYCKPQQDSTLDSLASLQSILSHVQI